MKFFLLGFLLTCQAHALSLYEKVSQSYPGFTPSIAPSVSYVDELSDTLPLEFYVEQCYMRAEIWSKIIEKTITPHPMKAFLFFTHAFKSRYYETTGKKYNWWFHVAPYLFVKTYKPDEYTTRVIDVTFTRFPLVMDEWVDDILDIPHKKCVDLTEASEFKKVLPEVSKGRNAVFGTEDCYIYHAPHTTFQPDDFSR